MAQTVELGEYAEWLEDVVKELVRINPVCIAMQMRDAEGETYTCYWRMDDNDRAIIISAIQEDALSVKLAELVEAMNGDTEEEEDEEGDDE